MENFYFLVLLEVDRNCVDKSHTYLTLVNILVPEVMSMRRKHIYNKISVY